MFRYIRKRKFLERISLTPEGFAYLAVLGFITIGSIIRNVNLLIVMAGIMYAPLFINWRMAVRRIRSIRGKRQLPQHLYANEMAAIKWICENTSPATPAINLIVRDQISPEIVASPNAATTETTASATPNDRGIFYRWFGELFDRLGRRKAGRGTALTRFARVRGGDSDVQAYQAFFAERGKYVFGPAEIYCSYPFGLIVSRQRLTQTTDCYVAPAVGRLTPTWEKRIDSVAKGAETVRRTRAIEEDEFFALRPWRSGDSRKNIHWRSTAKYGSPIVKQFVERNNRDFAVVLDLFDGGAAGDTAACETVLSFAATALLNIGTDVEGQVAVTACGQQCQVFRNRTVNGIIADAMPGLAVARPARQPDLVRGIIACLEAVSSNTPIYVVSSRPQLASLTSGLLVSTSDRENQADTDDQSAEAQRAAARYSRYVSRRIRQALPALRWLDVRSADFQDIFTLQKTGESQTSQDSLQQVSQRWLKDAES